MLTSQFALITNALKKNTTICAEEWIRKKKLQKADLRKIWVMLKSDRTESNNSEKQTLKRKN